jgi:hypothetical protein
MQRQPTTAAAQSLPHVSHLLCQAHVCKVSRQQPESRERFASVQLQRVNNLVFVVQAPHDLAIVARMRKVVGASYKEHRSRGLQEEGAR